MINGLIVVAHPDDDALFAAPYQLAHPFVNWVVVTATQRENSLRFAEMRAWQKWCGCDKVYTLDFLDWYELDDGTPLALKPDSTLAAPDRCSLGMYSVSDALLALIGQATYEVLLTHGTEGEYGHLDHKVVSLAVDDAIKQLPANRRPAVLHFVPGDTNPAMTVAVADYLDAAVTAYPSQAQVIRHLNSATYPGLCGVGRYEVHGYTKLRTVDISTRLW